MCFNYSSTAGFPSPVGGLSGLFAEVAAAVLRGAHVPALQLSLLHAQRHAVHTEQHKSCDTSARSRDSVHGSLHPPRCTHLSRYSTAQTHLFFLASGEVGAFRALIAFLAHVVKRPTRLRPGKRMLAKISHSSWTRGSRSGRCIYTRAYYYPLVGSVGRLLFLKPVAKLPITETCNCSRSVK